MSSVTDVFSYSIIFSGTSADSWKFLHPVVNEFFPVFAQSLQNIDTLSPESLVCSHPNSVSHLSKLRDTKASTECNCEVGEN